MTGKRFKAAAKILSLTDENSEALFALEKLASEISGSLLYVKKGQVQKSKHLYISYTF